MMTTQEVLDLLNNLNIKLSVTYSDFKEGKLPEAPLPAPHFPPIPSTDTVTALPIPNIITLPTSSYNSSRDSSRAELPLELIEDKFLMALCVWREASGQGEEGMSAVMHVIHNRARDWKQTITGIVIAHNQFTSMTYRGDPGTVRWPLPTDKAFQTAWKLANEIDSSTDITKGAHYYANLSILTSSWFRDNIVGKPDEHPVLAVIGAHTFYK
jgi:Cell Wall Hydrolase